MNLNELTQQLETKRAELKSIFDSYRAEDGSLNIPTDKMTEIEARNAEIKELGEKYTAARTAADADADNLKALGELQRVNRLPIAESKPEVKSFGELAVKALKQSGGVFDFSVKTLFQRSDGLAPERPRSGYVDYALLKPLGLFDFFNVVPIKGEGLKFIRETIAQGAVEKAEGAAFQEVDISYADVFIAAEKVTAILPVTDEVLADNAGLEQMLNGRLVNILQERFEGQAVAGTGVSPLLTGLLNTTNIQTYTRVTGENIGDAVITGASKIREAKAGNANLFLMNPADFTRLRLLKDDNGNYLYAELRDGVQPTLDGKPVMLNDSVTAETVLAVDRAHVAIGVREDVTVETGYDGSNFSQGKKSIRGSIRGNMIAYRPQAICAIDISDPA